MPLFDVGVGAPAGANRMDEIFLMLGIREPPKLLSHNHRLALVRSSECLPAATVATNAHHSLVAIQLDPRGVLQPENTAGT